MEYCTFVDKTTCYFLTFLFCLIGPFECNIKVNEIIYFHLLDSRMPLYTLGFLKIAVEIL